MNGKDPVRRDDKPAPLVQSHDAYFKAMFRWAAIRADFVHCFLPSALRGMLAAEEPMLEAKDFQGVSLHEAQIDVLLQVPLNAPPPDDYLYLLLEHKSAPDTAIHAQLATYQVAIMRQQSSIRRATKKGGFRYRTVLKWVIYNGSNPWPTPLRSSQQTSRRSALVKVAAAAFDSAYELLDLRQTPVDGICPSFPRLIAVMLALRGAISEKDLAKQRRKWPQLWQQSEPSVEAILKRIAHGLKDAPDLVKEQTLSYMSFSSRWETADYDMMDKLFRNEEGGATMPTIAERIERQALEREAPAILARGISQGMTQGRAEGMFQGMAESLIRQLQHRFGTLPDETMARIKESEPDDLMRWTERVLDAPALEAVFTDEPLSPRLRINGEP